MSKYYEAGKPLKLAKWNELLTDINKLAAAPPTGCLPVALLDLVTAPHIWSMKDITDARNALSLICPDNEFTELKTPQKWKMSLVDELETAIENGWCACIEKTKTFGPYSYQIVDARPRPISYWETPSALCAGQVGIYQEWTSDYVSCESRAIAASLGAQSDAAGAIAREALTQYVIAVNACHAASVEMDDHQETVDHYANECQNAADRWLSRECDGAGPSDPDLAAVWAAACTAICNEFNEAARVAAIEQEEVDRQFAIFQTNYVKIGINETLCDQKAAEASAAAMAMPVRFVGVDKNWYAEFIGGEIFAKSWKWKKWYNPNSDLGFTMLAPIDPYPPCYPNHCCPLPYFAVDWHLAGAPNTGSLGRFLTSPNGIPIPCNWNLLLHEMNIPRCQTQGWALCECLVPPCACGDNCSSKTTWGPEDWWWSGGCSDGGEAGWVWEPLPESGPGDYPSYIFELESDPLSARYNHDYTAEQTLFYRKYSTDWYKNHPKFDRDSYGVC